MAISITFQNVYGEREDEFGLTTINPVTGLVAPARSIVAVIAAGAAALGGATFNGLAMTLHSDVAVASGSPAARVFSLYTEAGATADVAVSFASNQISKALVAAVYTITGLAADAMDQLGFGQGSSTSPSSSAVTTGQAIEALIGYVAARASADVGGSWGGSFTNPQSTWTDIGDAGDVYLGVAQRSVTASGNSFTASKTGITSSPWTCGIATLAGLVPSRNALLMGVG